MNPNVAASCHPNYMMSSSYIKLGVILPCLVKQAMGHGLPIFGPKIQALTLYECSLHALEPSKDAQGQSSTDVEASAAGAIERGVMQERKLPFGKEEESGMPTSGNISVAASFHGSSYSEYSAGSSSGSSGKGSSKGSGLTWPRQGRDMRSQAQGDAFTALTHCLQAVSPWAGSTMCSMFSSCRPSAGRRYAVPPLVKRTGLRTGPTATHLRFGSWPRASHAVRTAAVMHAAMGSSAVRSMR